MDQEYMGSLADDYFPGYPKSTQIFLVDFIDKLSNFDHLIFTKIEFVACILAILINIFHSFILSQKSMRTSSTNVVLLGLSLIDILSMGLGAYADFELIFQFDEIPDICAEPLSYFRIMISEFSKILVDFSRRGSTYLSLSLVTIRAFAISQIMNPRFDFLTKPKTGWLTILANSIICGLLCIPQALSYHIESYPWSPPKGCVNKFPKNYKKLEYFFIASPWIIFDTFSMNTMLDAVLAKYVPVILFIVMTLVLIRAIKKASKDQGKSGKAKKDDPDKTSKLVLFTTISVIIAELPIGILYVFQSLYDNVIGWIMIGFFNPLYDQIRRSLNKQTDQLAFDRIDTLNAWFTPMFIGGLTLAISCKQYFGQPLKCWTPREFSGSWDGYVHDYCFIEDTYFVPNGTEITDIARGERQINYYRWVPLVLMLQALLFVVPYLIWNVMHKRTEINLKKSLRLYQKQCKSSGEKQACEAFGAEFCETLERIHRATKSFVGCQATINYFLLKLSFIANCVLQMFIIKCFLNLTDYFWAFEHLFKVEFKGTAEHESSIFPRVVLCDFKIRTLGQLQNHTVSCIMMLNMIIEKVYVMFYFWIIFVAVATTMATLTFAFQMLFRKHKLIPTNLNRKPNMNPTRSQDFLQNFLGADGLLLITFLDTQFGAYQTSQIVEFMVKKYLEARGSDSSVATSINDGNSPMRYASCPYDDSTLPMSQLKLGMVKMSKLDEVDGVADAKKMA
ncbi:unnamed protein product [Caenorhabditis angaria]|uniref:Innexin n=1 Tax=Caenorhabditis angaria TaxID=860376 RepID=A0A9P1IY86_9PELO|nr:unnamed protein product [Caenorhabditis angaria]